MGSVFSCKLNPCCGDRLNCSPPQQYTGSDENDRTVEPVTQRKLENASARVIVTLEVPAGSWGEKCQLSQVYDQAKTEALNRVQKMIQDSKSRIRIVGSPRVTAVLTERED